MELFIDNLKKFQTIFLFNILAPPPPRQKKKQYFQ